MQVTANRYYLPWQFLHILSLCLFNIHLINLKVTFFDKIVFKNLLMQQTVPNELQEPLDLPPKPEQALWLAQIPASALGEVQVVPSSQAKPEVSEDNRELMAKFCKGFRSDGRIRLSVSKHSYPTISHFKPTKIATNNLYNHHRKVNLPVRRMD